MWLIFHLHRSKIINQIEEAPAPLRLVYKLKWLLSIGNMKESFIFRKMGMSRTNGKSSAQWSHPYVGQALVPSWGIPACQY
jgi:hypothetical protein